MALAPFAAIGATELATPAAAAPAAYLTLYKSASVTNYSAAGTVITYSYLVTNVGPTTLNNVTVTDPMAGLSAINCGGNSPVIASLAPAASVTCTATYTTTLADLNAGSISNTGTVSADTPVGNFSAQSSLTIPAVENPQFNIVKTANVQSYSAVGQVVTYSFTVTNTGNVTITGILVTDSLPGLSAINCGGNSPVIPSLAPGASVTCTATYTVTAADLKRQTISNTAFAEGVGPEDGKISSSSNVVIPEAGQPLTCDNPADYLSQTNSLTGVPPTIPTQLYDTTSNVWTYATLGPAHAPTYNALGWDTIDRFLYATEVTPTPPTLVRIDASGVATAVGPITPFSGSFNFAANNGPDVGAFDASGDYWFMSSGTDEAWEIPAAEILSNGPLKAYEHNLVGPSGAPTDFGAADWTLAGGSNSYLWGLHLGTIYRLDIVGSGNLLVTSYTAPSQLAGTSAGADWQFSNGNLGFSNNATGTIYQVQVNTPATPTFTYKSQFLGPVAGRINDGTSCLGQPTDLGIAKTGPATVPASGTVTWSLTVTNYGPGNSSGYVVNDTIPAGVTGVTTSDPSDCTVTATTIQCVEGTLAVGNSYTILVTGTATAKVGSCFTNSASVLANEQDVNQQNNNASYTTCVSPGLTLVKSASVTSVSAAGTVITYSYQVTNSGPVPIYNVTVTDPMPGLSAINCGGNSPTIPVLAPSQTVTCTATYTTTTANINAGVIDNTGTATGQTASGPVSATSSVTIPAEQIPGVSIVKSSKVDSYSSIGQVIPYSFVVTNTGNVTLTNVTVTDPMPGLSAINCGGNSPVIPSLAPGASVTCTATYTVTAANLKTKSIDNVASVTGTTPAGTSVSSKSSLTIPEEGSPIVCSQEVDYLSQSNSSLGPPTVPTQLYDSFPNVWSYVTDGTPVTPTYNALGYDPKNDYLYATRVHPSSQSLVQIDANGAVVGTETIGAPYVNPGGGPDVGAFDTQGNYWFMTSNAPDAWEIPAAQIIAHDPVLTPLKKVLKGTFAPADWSEVNGALWGVSGTKIYKFAAGVVTTYNAPAAVAAVGAVDKTFGAAWTFSNGDLGVSNNVTGWIFEIHITGSGPPFSVVFQKRGPVAGSINDGAACTAINDADLGIVKTGPATVAQNGNVTWTLTVTNHGPGISSGYVVNDAVPGQYTNVASPTVGCTVVGHNVQCIEPTLYVGQSYTITITAKASAKPDVCPTNSATVIGNETDPNSKNNTSQVTTCTTSGIVVVKTADVTSYAQPGDVIGYSFDVKNTNAVTSKDPVQTTADTLSDVTVTDAMKGLSQIECGPQGDHIATLAPGASAKCTAFYTVTAGDVKAGSIANVAVATGYLGTGALEHSATSTVTTPRGVHVTTSTLKGATVGVAYRATLAATGGKGKLSWSLAAGELPKGLKLSTAGVLSGKGSAAGLYSFTVRVTSAKTSKAPAETATQTLTLDVRPPAK